MKWIPKFRYPGTSGTVLTLTRSQGLWTPRVETIGGHRRAAVPTVAASFTIARLRTLDLLIRFDENEYDNIETMVEWMQDNPMTAVDYWPDKDVAGTSYTILLVSPVQGEAFAPARNPSFTSDYEIVLTVMRSGGTSWGAQPYYE
jgi:hypothetical protein